MRRIARRDTAAFELLYNAHYRLIYGIGLRLLGDIASAEDLTQSVFLKIWTNPDAYRGGSVSAWIARVTRNSGLDVLRRRTSFGTTEIPADTPLDGAIEDVVFARLDAQHVRTALTQLPAKERSAIELGFFGGMTYHRVAAETGAPLGTVKTRIRTGLLRLRVSLAIVRDTSGA